jgi:hypothetical protein
VIVTGKGGLVKAKDLQLRRRRRRRSRSAATGSLLGRC